MDNGIESLARAWAFEAHKDQSYGPHSYRYHLEDVVEKIRTFSNDADLLSAGWLHDGPEDTDMSIAEIQAKISFDCGEIVNLMTDPPGYDKRSERKPALYRKFDEYTGDIACTHSAEKIKEFAAIGKGSDRWANHRESISTLGFGTMKMYSREFPEFIRTYGPYMPLSLHLELFEQYNAMIIILHEHRHK